MEQLYVKLRDDAEKWRKEGYPCSRIPAYRRDTTLAV